MSRILVIDDDKQMREMLKQTLERAGYAVIEAANGVEGLTIHREQHVDVVITDLIMPGKDGMETIIELKREFPDVRIIAVSGGNRAMDPRDYLLYTSQFGVRHTFTKPFDTKEIINAIESLLQVRKV